MKLSLKQINKAFEIGKDKVTDQWFLSKLRLINKTLTLVVFCIILYVITFSFFDMPILIWPCLIALLISVLSFWFSSRGWFDCARIIPQLMVNFTIVFYELVHPDLGFIYYFFPLIATIFTTFQFKEWKKYLPVLFVAFISILLLVYTDYRFFSNPPLSPFLINNGQAIGITLSTVALMIILSELVSEDHHTKRELEKESTNLSGIIESTDDAIWLVDQNYRFITFNTTFSNWVEKSIGIPAYKGLNAIEVMEQKGQNLSADIKANYDWVFKTGKVLNRENYVEVGDLQLYTDSSYNPIMEGGQVVAISCFSRDITDRKKMEKRLEHEKTKAEEASKAKSWFLSNMSHELRTPLNAISGVTQLMEREDRPETDLDNLKVVRQSTDQLVALINDILDLSKIEAGQITIQNTQFKISETLGLIDNNFSQKANEKGIQLKTSLDHALPAWLYGENTRLLQVLNNLVSNALKFTNQGSVKVYLENKEESHDQVILKGIVEDTGIGIPENQQSKLFEDFKQIEQHASRNYEGTGLGLSIAKNLVTILGGSIDLTSQEGQGSRFFFEIPFGKVAVDDEEGIQESEESNVSSELTDLQEAKILLVEDNELNIKVGTQIFKRLNAEPWSAKEGQEALALVEKEQFQIILLDIHMPGMDGLEVAKSIRNSENGLTPASVPIVIMSADISQNMKQKAKDAQINGFLEKPLNIEKIAQTVHDQLDNSARPV